MVISVIFQVFKTGSQSGICEIEIFPLSALLNLAEQSRAEQRIFFLCTIQVSYHTRGRIFSHVRPFCEWAVSDLDP